ncbi:transmembrane signal receptor [Lithospermum erythrorhizon]|uniref:Transmembrane signal receptor n=1 Tax=Lithospermum erythrorhizon TaxID=34254 RepID=A0AAV3PIC6_LITER
MIISISAQKNWKIYQLDLKSAFIHGELTEEVYVDQPRGYKVKGTEHQVYKLHKALYGLKQAPRAWYSRIESHFAQEGFMRRNNEQTLFTKRGVEGRIAIVSLYVDDLIYTGDDDEIIRQFKNSMVNEFDMTDLGCMNYFLGIEVIQGSKGIFICQKRYAEELLARFGMSDSNSVSNPIVPGTRVDKDAGRNLVDETQYKQIVGSLMYLTSTRPDIMYVTSLISKFMSNPTELHMHLAKRILRYLKGTIDFGILYKEGSAAGKFIAYTDSDYAGDHEDTKKAEFVAATACTCQAIWMSRILKELSNMKEECLRINCDNSSTIKLSKNPVMHGRCKHIDIRYHFLRDLTKEETIELIHCGSTDQIADVMTKPLKTDQFQKLRAIMGICSVSEVI